MSMFQGCYEEGWDGQLWNPFELCLGSTQCSSISSLGQVPGHEQCILAEQMSEVLYK